MNRKTIFRQGKESECIIGHGTESVEVGITGSYQDYYTFQIVTGGVSIKAYAKKQWFDLLNSAELGEDKP